MAEGGDATGADNALPKEGIVTALRTLGHFHDAEVHSVLIKYFFHPDPVIGREALRSSASKMNEAAVTHLLKIIEGGKSDQKIEALRTLSSIDAPHVIESLLKYFSVFTDAEVQQELLRTMNDILPFQEKIVELNRGVLTSSAEDVELGKIAVQGLVTAEDFTFLNLYLLHAPSPVQYQAFMSMLLCGSKDVPTFLKKLEITARSFEEKTKGAYLGAYFLKVPNPSMHYTLNALQKAPEGTYCTLLSILMEHVYTGGPLKDIFRFLLLLPFVGEDMEILISELIKKLIELAEKRSSGAVNELRSITTIHLESVFRKVRENHISLRGIKQKGDLLPTLLAHLLEKCCPASLILEVQKHFRGEEGADARRLVESLRDSLKDGEKSDLNGFKAVIPLFLESDRKKRLKVSAIVNRIDPQISHLLRRLNRLIKAAGFLRIENQSKKVAEILSFSADEKIAYIQEASIITLCQLAPKNFIREAERILRKPSASRNVLKSYIRGARYLPPEVACEPLVDLLFCLQLDPAVKDLIIESLALMDLAQVEALCPKLLKALELEDISLHQREKIGPILSRFTDTVPCQPLLETLKSGDDSMKTIVMRIIRDIANERKDIPMDVLTGKLYSLLDHPSVMVRVEALFTLLALGDDYAEKVAGDWLEGDDERVTGEVLCRMKDRVTDSLLLRVLGLLRVEKLSIQEILRQLLSSLAAGPFAEKVRDALLVNLRGEGEISFPGIEEVKSAVTSRGNELFLHPKIEFKLRREHSQQLTVFFIDMVGYTALSQRADVTNLMKLIEAFEEHVLPTVESYNGSIVKKLGDGILAVFKHPASAAIAALEIQGKINEYNRYAVDTEKFQVRIGLHLGDVIWKDDDIFGDVVNIASRMETSAGPGEIMLTEDTYKEIRDFVTCDPKGELQVKGIESPIKVYTPRGVVKDVKALLDIKKSNIEALMTVEDGGAVYRLREALFSPRFDLPPGALSLTGAAGRVIELLRILFRDLAEAASTISRDYREEFLFKHYLQEKWDEAVEKLKGEE